jgi:hypothetical protein
VILGNAGIDDEVAESFGLELARIVVDAIKP